MIVTCITTFFIFFQLLGFVLTAEYNMSFETVYLGGGGIDYETYYIKVGEYLPTFIIQLHDEDTDFYWFNDRSYYDFYYEEVSFDDTGYTIIDKTRHEAILCADYINGTHWEGYSQEERDSAYD